MPTVRIKENEPFEVAMRRFKRTVEKTGLLTELRAREYYEKPTSERKRKLAAAVKRHHKRLRSQMLPAKQWRKHHVARALWRSRHGPSRRGRCACSVTGLALQSALSSRWQGLAAGSLFFPFWPNDDDSPQRK